MLGMVTHERAAGGPRTEHANLGARRRVPPERKGRLRHVRALRTGWEGKGSTHEVGPGGQEEGGRGVGVVVVVVVVVVGPS